MKTNWTLIAKVLEEEPNERELHDFESWYQQSHENKQLYDMLKENWDSAKQEDENIRVDVDKAWMDLHNRLEREQLIPRDNRQPVARSMIRPVMRAAAAVLLLVALGTVSYFVFLSEGKSVQMTASTQNQQKFGLNLPDGSRVDLNAGSKLTYKLQRSGTRMVKLEGEAWFDVSPDESSPFVIRAGNGTVRVTGTSFTVRTVPGTKKIEVYVESGNVQFYRSRKKDRILSLKAGQMGVLEQNQLNEKTIIEPNHLSWKTRKLKFRDTRLGDVAGVLNRTYSQNIRFTNETLEDCLFTGTFDQQPIDSVVRVIQVAFGLDVDRDGRAYVFSGDGCQ
jgi:ferric-dicitrate binding protein FerR (iron transport regulator)